MLPVLLFYPPMRIYLWKSYASFLISAIAISVYQRIAYVIMSKSYPQSLKNSIRLDSTFLDGLFQSLGLLLCDFILLFRCQSRHNLIFQLSSILRLFSIIFFVVLVLLFQSHTIRLKQEVLPPQMFDIFEVSLQLLGKLLNGKKLLALLSCLKLTL